MKRHHINFVFRLISCCLIISLSITLQTVAAEQGLLAPDKLIDELKKGGLIIFFRHAATDHSKDDLHPVVMSDCATQRNLSQRGREQAKNIGKTISRLGILIDDVVSSPFCRCHDTAELMFGRYRLDDNLYFAVAVDKERREEQAGYLRGLLSSFPKQGMNNVIVSHTGNLREASGIWPKPEGVAWIFRPKEKGQYEALGSIDPSFWTNAR